MGELPLDVKPTLDAACSEASEVSVSPGPNVDGASNPIPEARDDTPTVISHMASRMPRPDEAFVTQLKGRRLAHFELSDSIGVGGMAAVIRARDVLLDREVALKILPPDLAADPENVRRFQHEARAAAKLHHDNIAGVFYCGEDQGLHFIAFEFVEGEDLRAIIQRRGRLPVAEAVRYVLQIATGLAHSSARGVVHRDIKPSNILITAAGCAKLVDMGLARNQDCHGDEALTQSGVTLGTYDYISPEQAIEPRDVDVRSDIYSLGCTFYHMVTGTPPVPDGTAAKKLHHHQHVPPIDPRQYNAEIPDEVAAILSRMMAKEASKRYTDAEQLLRHLAPLARRLNPGAEFDVDFVCADSPLPAPPRLRPPVIAAIAATFAFGLIGLHEWMLPTPKTASWPIANNLNPLNEPTIERPAPAVSVESHPIAKAQSTEGSQNPTREVATLSELARSANDPGINDIVITGDVDLGQVLSSDNHRGAFGVTINRSHNRPLTIRGKSETRRPQIQLRYHSVGPARGTPSATNWTAFCIANGDVEFRGIRFEIDARQAPVAMASVKAADGARVRLQDCEMMLLNPPIRDDSPELSSVLAEGAHITVKRCYFGTMHTSGVRQSAAAGTTSAVTLIGGTAEIRNSAFAPHAHLFRIRDSAGARPAMTLASSSCLLANTTAFRIDSGVYARLTVDHSLFSAPNHGDTPAGGTLIEQADPLRLSFHGAENRYHQLSAFLTRTSSFGSASITAWDEFRRTIETQGGADTQSVVLAETPWAETDPIAMIDSGRVERAFQIDANSTELRLADRGAVTGVEEGPWSRAYTKPLPLKAANRPAAPFGKVVDPSIKGVVGDTFESLELAVAAATPGDTILIKARELRVDPVSLCKKSTADLTLRPFPGFQPLLILGDTTERDAALFRVHDGKLRLEGLEFRLRPDRDEFNTQAVVDLVGEGECTLKDCTITLETTLGKPLSVVVLSDSSHVMKSEASASESPNLSMENCFIRGTGHFVAIRSTRALDLRVENTLVALVGSFLHVEAASNDAGTVPTIQMKLSHVTTFLTDYLIRLHALTRGKDPVVIHVNPAIGCLFASAEGKSLVHLEGVDVGPEQMRSLFSWDGGRQNAYSRFQPMLDQAGQGDELPSPSMDQQRWKAFTGELDALFPFPPIKFADSPEAPLGTSLVWAAPSQFRVASDSTLAGYGVNVDALPKPRIALELVPRAIR